MALEPKATVFSEQSSEKNVFVWKIPNFSETIKSDELVRSQNYSLEMGQDLGIPIKWNFYLSMDNKWVGIYSRPVECPKHTSHLRAHLKVQIEGNSTPGEYYFSKTNSFEIQPGNQNGFPKMIPQNALLPLAEDGSLEIIVTIVVFNIGRKIQVHKQGSEKKSFLWTIPFFEAMRSNPAVVNGQKCTFRMGSDIGIPTKWECYLAVDTDGVNKCIGVYARLTEYPKGLDTVQARVRFQTTHRDFEVHARDMTQGKRHGIREFIAKNDNPTTHDGTLEITVSVTLFTVDTRDSQLASTLAEYESTFCKKFRANLADIQSKPLDVPDKTVYILSKDNKLLPIDPYILAARCPSLKKGLEAIMARRRSHVLEMKGMAAESLEVFLEFCHTGTLKETWKQAPVLEELVFCAHKYELDDLKEFFDHSLVCLCTPTNIGKLMNLAKTFGLTNAENGILEYLKTNMYSCMENNELTGNRQEELEN